MHLELSGKIPQTLNLGHLFLFFIAEVYWKSSNIFCLLRITKSSEQEQYICIVCDKSISCASGPYHGPQMLRTQLQIRLQQPRKGYKNNFRKELKNKSGKWSMTTKSFMCSKKFEESDFVYYTNDTNKRRNRKLQ